MRASARNGYFLIAILGKNPEASKMMFVTPRCNNAGPLGKSIRTRSFAACLLARLPGFSRLRW
jgi:hypothetical protein